MPTTAKTISTPVRRRPAAAPSIAKPPRKKARGLRCVRLKVHEAVKYHAADPGWHLAEVILSLSNGRTVWVGPARKLRVGDPVLEYGPDRAVRIGRVAKKLGPGATAIRFADGARRTLRRPPAFANPHSFLGKIKRDLPTTGPILPPPPGPEAFMVVFGSETLHCDPARKLDVGCRAVLTMPDGSGRVLCHIEALTSRSVTVRFDGRTATQKLGRDWPLARVISASRLEHGLEARQAMADSELASSRRKPARARSR